MLLLCLKQYKDTLFNSTRVQVPTMVSESLHDLYITPSALIDYLIQGISCWFSVVYLALKPV